MITNYSATRAVRKQELILNCTGYIVFLNNWVVCIKILDWIFSSMLGEHAVLRKSTRWDSGKMHGLTYSMQAHKLKNWKLESHSILSYSSGYYKCMCISLIKYRFRDVTKQMIRKNTHLSNNLICIYIIKILCIYNITKFCPVLFLNKWIIVK